MELAVVEIHAGYSALGSFGELELTVVGLPSCI
jgi:hypothetical protein